MSKLDELKKQKEGNFKERIWFIKYWVKFIKEHPDRKWSEGQRVLIDSQIKGARERLSKG